MGTVCPSAGKPEYLPARVKMARTFRDAHLHLIGRSAGKDLGDRIADGEPPVEPGSLQRQPDGGLQSRQPDFAAAPAQLPTERLQAAQRSRTEEVQPRQVQDHEAGGLLGARFRLPGEVVSLAGVGISAHSHHDRRRRVVLQFDLQALWGK